MWRINYKRIAQERVERVGSGGFECFSFIPFPPPSSSAPNPPFAPSYLPFPPLPSLLSLPPLALSDGERSQANLRIAVVLSCRRAAFRAPDRRPTRIERSCKRIRREADSGLQTTAKHPGKRDSIVSMNGSVD